jgi:hypothetical protein
MRHVGAHVVASATRLSSHSSPSLRVACIAASGTAAHPCDVSELMSRQCKLGLTFLVSATSPRAQLLLCCLAMLATPARLRLLVLCCVSSSARSAQFHVLLQREVGLFAKHGARTGLEVKLSCVFANNLPHPQFGNIPSMALPTTRRCFNCILAAASDVCKPKCHSASGANQLRPHIVRLQGSQTEYEQPSPLTPDMLWPMGCWQSGVPAPPDV